MPGTRLEFGNCELDLDRRELRRDGALVTNRSKVIDLLAVLIDNRERVVPRDELLDLVWGRADVSQATLDSTIRAVRDAVGDSARSPRFIKTLRGQGVRFIGELRATREPTVAADPAQAEWPAIALLPFAIIGGDTMLEHLADGLVEDLTTELSRYKQFVVIARNSSFRYRGLANDIGQIGRELGAQYVLEGSMRRTGRELRTTAQLTHARTLKHIWADHFECPFDDPSSLQGEILHQLIQAIGAEMTLDVFRESASHAEGSNDAERPIAMAWRARMLFNRSRAEAKPELFREGMALAEQAVKRDSNCRQAWWTVSFANYMLAFARGNDGAAPFLARAREAAETLRMLDNTDFRAYESLGWVSFIERDMEAAYTQLGHAHRLNPNSAMTLTLLGIVQSTLGDAESGYLRIEQAIAVSPRDPWLGFMLAAKALACFALARYAEGLQAAEHAVQHDSRSPAANMFAAACAAHAGNYSKANSAMERQARNNPALLAQYLDGQRSPYQDEDIATRFRQALCNARDESSREQ